MVDISTKVRRAAAAMGIAMSLAACTGGVHDSGSSGGTPNAPQYTLGGTVSGLAGSGLVLASNTGETVNVSADGTFTFKTTFPDGSPYYVLVLTQPGTPIQTCVAGNGSGTIQSSNVTGITVTCKTKTTPTDTIGGVVVGLTGSGLVLQNGSDTVAVTANGAFVFPTALASGTPYSVSVLSPPIKPYEDCAVLNGKGTTDSSDITNIGIVCAVNSSPTHTISGTITGVSGTIVLENNGRDDLTISADGAFKFPLGIPSGSSYDVTTKSASGLLSQACTFANATGLVGDSDVTNVTISCKANIGLTATVSGLAGTGLILQNTGNGDTLPVTTNGTVAFPTGIAPGQAYNVIVTAQPTNLSQTCVVGNGAGTAPETTTVIVTCTNNTYTVSGIILGLPDPQASNSSVPPDDLVLQDNLGETFTVAPNASSPVPFNFPTPFPSGSTYSVTVRTQPGVESSNGIPGSVQTSSVCVVAGGTGTATSADVTDVVVTCVRPGGFAYVTNSADNTVSAYVIDNDTGQLVAAAPPVPTGTNPTAATVSTFRNGTPILYVTNSGSNNVSGYTIDPNTGALTELPGSPFAMTGLSAPTSIAATDLATSASWVYATNPGAGSPGSTSGATVVDATGALTDIAGSPLTANYGPTSASYFNGGDYPTYYKFILEADSVSNTVSSYLIDSTTGALSMSVNARAPVGTTPTSIAGIQDFVSAVETNLDYVYVTNSGDGTISIFSMDTQSGNLTPLQASPVTLERGVQAVAGSSTYNDCGCFVFASGQSGVWAFSTDNTGALTALAGSPYPAGNGPGAIAALNNYGVYVINTVDQAISAYLIGGAGQPLTPATGTPAKTGRGPSSIVVIFRPYFSIG